MQQIETIGLIPAAGKGSRMGLPFPKELFPIFLNNSFKPIIHFSIDRIRNADVQHIVLVVNEKKHQLINYLGNGAQYHCNFSFVFQDMINGATTHSTSPGLAHAIDAAYHLIRRKNVFFCMADTIQNPESILKEAYQKTHNKTNVTLILFKTGQPEKFGMVEYEKRNGKVIKIIDKPTSTKLEWMWGSIIWDPEFTKYLHVSVKDRKLLDFATILNNAIKDGLAFQAIEFQDGSFVDIGNINDAQELYPSSIL